VVLAIGKKDPKYGKWSPNWEGPFRVRKVLNGGAYWLENLEGEQQPRFINEKYLKRYYPMVTEMKDQ